MQDSAVPVMYYTSEVVCKMLFVLTSARGLHLGGAVPHLSSSQLSAEEGRLLFLGTHNTAPIRIVEASVNTTKHIHSLYMVHAV